MMRLARIAAASTAVLVCGGGYAASQWIALIQSPLDPASYTQRIEASPVPILAGVLLAVRLVQKYLPPEGIYLVAALAGLTDVDAITLSMAEAARGGDSLLMAANAVTVAVLANTAVKCGMVVVLGSAPLRRRVVLVTVLLVLAAVVALVLM